MDFLLFIFGANRTFYFLFLMLSAVKVFWKPDPLDLFRPPHGFITPDLCSAQVVLFWKASICLDSVLMFCRPFENPQKIFMMFLSIQWENLFNHLLLQYDIYVDSMIKVWLGRIVKLKFKEKKKKEKKWTGLQHWLPAWNSNALHILNKPSTPLLFASLHKKSTLFP